MPTYDPSKTYAVRLTRVVNVGRLRLLPRNPHEIRGDALNELVAAEGEDIIDAADPIAE